MSIVILLFAVLNGTWCLMRSNRIKGERRRNNREEMVEMAMDRGRGCKVLGLDRL